MDKDTEEFAQQMSELKDYLAQDDQRAREFFIAFSEELKKLDEFKAEGDSEN